jgi:hypothetical protein
MESTQRHRNITYHWARYLPISNPRAGNETVSVSFLFAAESNLLRCKHRISGSVTNTCCWVEPAVLLHEGQCKLSDRRSGFVKCSRHDSIAICPWWFSALGIGSDMLTKDSIWVLLQLHCWHTSTDRSDPVKISFTLEALKWAQVVSSSKVFYDRKRH